MNHYVMDYETLVNCFCGVFIHYKSSETHKFVIHESKDDFEDFIIFLKKNIKHKEWHISYNGLAFDAQITEYILKNENKLRKHIPFEKANLIYRYAQTCIHKSNTGEWQDYPEWRMKIGQIDLFKMNHWDNNAKRSSLKWIQFSMDWDNLLDMPIEHYVNITKEQVDTVVEYCVNDVESTKEIFNRSKSQIKLRKDLTKQFDVNLFSASEPRIGKEVFSYYMSKRLNIHPKQLKGMRTERFKIKLKDLILPYIEFKSDVFKSLLETFKRLELDPASLKGSFKHRVVYKNVTTDFGLGGVHGVNTSGIYESDEDYVIMSSDVTSFYPNLVIRNGWSPGHFPADDFCAQYEWFFDERVKIPKSNPMNYVYKIILNSIFGLSNEPNSFFYDPELCMRITVNGQLSLIMLYEMIMEEIPNATGIMQNTDGVEIKIPRKHVDKYLEICKSWEDLTKLKLEHDQYQKIVLADVNNYIAIHEFKSVSIDKWRELMSSNPHYLFKVINSDFIYAPVKMKGRFDFHGLALHKNKSKLIIRKALHAYFVNDILPTDFINNPKNQNIIDYCIGSKSKGNWTQYARSITNGIYKEEELQRTNRYYISNKGVKIVKMSDDGREIQLESGKWMQTIYNKMEIKNWKEYNVNTQYYISAIESEITNIIYRSVNQFLLL
jgi:hypothetical protein